MMKLSNAFRSFWHAPAAVVVASVLASGASTAFAQTSGSPMLSDGAPLTLQLSDPAGSPLTLVYSADGGWRLHAGTNVAQSSPRRSGFIKTALMRQPAPAAQEPAPTERPLAVFVDGPTGFTYVYAADEGWKFVGQVASR
jgi:hypothetical protein